MLGGGLVPGALVLLGGEPGIGKSTLVLEVAARSRARRAAPDGALRVRRGVGGTAAPARGTAGLSRRDRAGETDRGLCRDRGRTRSSPAAERAPDALIIDSIQTLTAEGLEGPAGSVGQVREATARLGAFAREHGVPAVLVGHVTKDGTLAGPKTLEHIVDVVLMLEGERFSGAAYAARRARTASARPRRSACSR